MLCHFFPDAGGVLFRLFGAIACEYDLDLRYFDAEQAFVQSTLEEDVSLLLPQVYGEMSGKIVRLNGSLYGLKQASRSWHNHLVTHMTRFGIEQRPADACVMRLIESGSVSIVMVVHVDGMFVVRVKSWYDQLCEDLNRLVPVNKLGELRWYAGCRFSWDWDVGTLTISQQAFAENTSARFGVSSGRNNPLSTGLKLEELDGNEPVGDSPFRELVWCSMWLANQTRPDNANAVRGDVHEQAEGGALEYNDRYY